jgi:hypothetical protein
MHAEKSTRDYLLELGLGRQTTDEEQFSSPNSAASQGLAAAELPPSNTVADSEGHGTITGER